MRKRAFMLLLASSIMLSSCNLKNTIQVPALSEQAKENSSYTKDIFAMDTYMTLTAYGEHAESAVEESLTFIRETENKMSTNIESSEISQMNQNGSGTVSKDTFALIERSMQLNEDTKGAFDITMYPIIKAWGFTTGEYQIPTEEELQSLLNYTGNDWIEIDREANTVTFDKVGVQIDLGGIAKGYTSSEIMDIFQKHGVKSGIVSLGGNVQVLGSKENGAAWNVAIRSPKEEEDYLGILKVTNKAVITSGGYERYFEEDGENYHHIIDPSTGHPAKSGLLSVTIVSEDGTLADGLSTALFVMGKEKAISYWREHKGDFDFILVGEDETVYVSDGIANEFTTEHKIEIIEE